MARTPKITACEIEIAVATMFGWRDKIIVPNVSWGLSGLGHEADLLVMSMQGWCREIEIKVSGSDITADLHKRHGHKSRLVRQLYFAVPDKLAEHPDLPVTAGLIVVTSGFAKIVREAPVNKSAVKLDPSQMKKVLHLAAMRIWSLKSKLMHQVQQRRFKESNENISNTIQKSLNG